MSEWSGKLRKWLGAGKAPDAAENPDTLTLSGNAAGAPRPGAPPPSAPAASAPADTPGLDTSDLEPRYFELLTGVAVHADAPLTDQEQNFLVRLDTVLFQEETHDQLLPRARSSVPQLLASLQQENQTLQSLAAQVGRDPNLVIEVIRMANSTGYRGDSPVVDPTQAIARLGTEGLRRAVARVMLKPIFDAEADPLLGHAAERIWQHSEICAGLCLQQALQVRIDPFEAYLAGLMINVGWTAALRAMDRSELGVPASFSVAFVHSFGPRRERLFGSFVRAWNISTALTALSKEVMAAGLMHGHSPLAKVLYRANQAATQHLLSPPKPQDDGVFAH